MNYKHIITILTLAFILALTACAGGGGGGSSSGSNEPVPSVVRANTYNAQGEVTGYKVTTINSDLNPIAETYYDNDGQPLSTIEYTYDGPRLTGRIHRNISSGEIISRTSISYAGTTRRSNRYAPNGDLLSFTLTTTNERGQTTREETYAPNGSNGILREYTIYIYDGGGFRTEQRNFDADGKLTTYTRYRYHPDRTLRSEHTYDAEGLLVDYTTYTYGRGDAASLSNPKDTDGDGQEDEEDNCPTIANRDQANTYGGPDDKEGDACDDTDNDDVYDLTDNCPTTPNNRQTDSDGDGTGDACDEHHTRPGENVTFNDISRLEHLLSIAGKSGYARLTAHIEITPEVLRTYTGSAEWTPLPHYGVLDGNGYTIRGLNHQALFSTIGASARVTNLGILGGIMANINDGTISNSYATGDSIGSGIRGGLVRLNNGIIRDSYALGDSTTELSNGAGGLVGNNNPSGLIIRSYATGNATGGLTGNNRGTATNSYAVHSTANTLGEQRTIRQLQCPTRPGDPLCGSPPTYIGWNSTVWDFGRDNELPTLRGFVLCPRSVSNCHRYRAAGDADNDGVANLIDNCLTTPNPHQYNNDSDPYGDACDTDDDNDGDLDGADNCPLIANADQDNTDSVLEPPDGINGITILGDACDPDDDGDYINDDEDNCQYIRNFLQVNTDGDALGDKCDPDDDNDFRLDTADNCPHIQNTNQANADGDALGDACDPDLDGDGHNNTLPGTGIAVINPTDNCPTVANPDQTDTDLLFRIRLGLEPKSDGGDACDDDDDEDGRLDISDNCPTIYNPDQKDTDLRLRIRLDLEPKIDGGDACDYDLDGDGHNNTLSYTNVPGATDNCPRVWNEDQANTDNDALGDACDPDRDGDGYNNTLPDIPDIIVLEAKDNCPYIANPLQTNTDSDELGDACDPDLDGDGHNNILSYIDVPNANDNCPTIPNPQQTNTDGDALGDACDPDLDGDGYNNTLPGTGISVINATDNCPTISNRDQANLDSQTESGEIGIDILGDACDPDIDGDGDLNAADNCPTISNPDQKDTDLRRRILLGLEPKVDGGDACDHDLDEDGHNNTLPGTGIPVINPTDNCPTIFNRDQANADNDALGDACDPDRDGDGHNNTLTGTGILVINPTDNCPTIPNPDQSNTITPGNAKGDACDDPDTDGIYDISDNCPTIANPKQANLDRDATGDACDPLTPITNTTTLQAITIGNYQITTHLAVPGPWTPIRNFRGTLNGGNHTISGLTGPLFHTISARATVTAIGIIGSTLAYNNHGTINASYATGDSNTSRTGTIRSGGLVDHNTGLITTSYAAGNIGCDTAGTCFIGGLVGASGGTIINSYATGDITCGATGDTCAPGGLVGALIGTSTKVATITTSYATGAITCPPTRPGCATYGGGLVGFSNDHSDIKTSYRLATKGDPRAPHRSLAQLQCPTSPGATCQGATTYSSWDDSIWDFGTDQDLPELRGLDRDRDNDGINDNADNCPMIPNRNQANNYGTDRGDACEDTDSDGTLDKHDNCPTDANIACQGIASYQNLTHHLTGGNDGYYRLTANINISADTTWTPITNFRGTLNGGNHTITFHAAQPNPPLFDTINSTATVTNIGIFNSILAHTNHGNISYAYATGSSSSDGSRSNSGGLVDYNTGTITHSYATGDSTCTGPSCRSGGLVGRNTGTITNSYAAGNSTCTGSSCNSGGLVGRNTGTITLSYAIGDSSGEISGGLVGRNTGTITNSYATGASTGSSGNTARNGGLVGSNAGIITNSYAAGDSSIGTGLSGGLVGRNFRGTITNSYRVQPSGTNTFGDHRTLAQLHCPTASGDTCEGNTTYNGWDSTMWDFGTSDDLPTLVNLPPCPADNPKCRHRITLSDNDNDGIEDINDNCPTDPNTACIGIATARDLMDHLTTDASGYYRLTENITITTAWTPITNFRGTLNGENHTILFRNGTQPLFHTINSMATVTNIGILNSTLARINHGKISYAYATGNSVCSERTCSSGGLVGYNTGTITNAYATGDSACTGSRCYSGGLVGYNTGTITNSYATGNSRGVYNGGLVGWNTGTITNSYATGDSTCSSFGCRSGGLVGRNYRGTITHSYATGNSHGSSRSGGLVGHNDNGGTITHSYATGNSSSDFLDSGGLVGSNNGRITNSYATGNSHSRSRSQTRYSGGLVGRNENAGHITNSYATGDSTCPIGYCYSGGLIGSNSGRVTNSYATGDSACTGSNCDSGGLVGSHGRGIITNSYATGYSACTGLNCRNGGLVGRNYRGTITNSYRVQPSGTTFGDHRILAQLRCPTAPGDNCQGNTTYSGWNSNIWNFSTPDDLPILVNLPLCPADNPKCRHRITLSDNDNDGIEDINDNCPTTANRDQADLDGDTTGNACDTDKDGDGYPDTNDAFPRNATEHQDSDDDRIGDNADNCPTTANRDQADLDGDTTGDVCDAFPNDPTEHQDSDGDRIGDNADSCRLIPNAQYQDRSYTTCQDITSAADLMNNLTADASGYYRLTANITVPADTIWTPITNFNGTFNGDNHTITFGTAQPNPPLFDTINSTATVTNIGILNSTLAYTNHGKISYAYATGNSTCSGPFCYSGGLVSKNQGIITHSYATGDSTCTGSSCRSGGLVGFNRDTITNSYATGNSTCTNSSCLSGGLVGFNFYYIGTITKSYATGNVRGGISGGLVGLNYGTIINSYATGDSICTSTNSGSNCRSGGLVGHHDFGTIDRSYATGYGICTDSNSCYSGGLAGGNLRGTITNSYRVQTTGTNTLGTAITLANLRVATSFNGWLSPPWDFGDTTTLPTLYDLPNCPPGNPNCRHRLTDSDNDGYANAEDAFPTDPTEHQDSDGDGIGDTADSCPRIPNAQYQSYTTCQDINTAQDLMDHLTDGDDGYYRLTTNITIPAGTTWTPIINFRGTLNGDNHTITFGTAQLNTPLFGTINSTATVTNIGILNSTLAYINYGKISYAYATGDSYGSIHRIHNVYLHNISGGLVGTNAGTITNSYATGDSSSSSSSSSSFNSHSGGLVGYNLGGTITRSYATGNSSSSNGYNSDSGGLVGINFYGTITNSYATGDSSSSNGSSGSNSYSGGLVGRNEYGRITNSYATGDSSSITLNTYAIGNSICTSPWCYSGGLVGVNYGGTITNSHRVQTTGNTLGTARTFSNLRVATSFNGWLSPPWDFGDTTTLPTLYDMPNCPPGNPNCRHRIPDSDNDGYADVEDAFPTNPTEHQDTDGDRIGDKADNCPTSANRNQTDLDGDNYGDACDAFPNDPTEHQDTDGDRIGDKSDPDDDNDGYPDLSDTCPLVPNAQYQDASYSSCRNIANHEELINALNGIDSASGYYLLTQNITITITTTWIPSTNFRGTLNGDNHTITFSTAQPNPPLFDTINAPATVTNIGILNSTLAYTNHGNISYAYATGGSTCSGSHCRSGGLVRYNTGNITHSYATGDSTCDGHYGHYPDDCYIGGLVGSNSGTISDSYATGKSWCFTEEYCDSGGLVGSNSGTISDSYATGESICSNEYYCDSGGLVGSNTGNITNSYATGSSSSSNDGESYSGGLVGRNTGTISNSYATGSSSSYDTSGEYRISYSGGLVGYNSGNISNSYATGDSTCTHYGNDCDSGGLVGRNDRGTITNSYATGNSTCTHHGDDCYSGGLVGYNSGTITNSYATGSSTCTASYNNCYIGGLVGSNGGAITNSYHVQPSGTSTSGDHRTLAQLRCPTEPGDSTCTPTTYTGWNATIWNFGESSDLPTMYGMPPCPTDNPNCRHRITLSDNDNDGIEDINDNCPTTANANQANNYGTAAGDACEDTDNDGTLDKRDNCPTIANPNQANNYGNDNEGDACDDTDGDTHLDISDAFPTDPTEHQDSDGDGRGDSADSCPNDANTACIGIANAQDLRSNLTAGISGYYRLTANITLSAGTTWTPVTNFLGTLNGENHTITFHNGTQPLFDSIGSTATVTNIGILNSTLARVNHGNISYAYATGDSVCSGRFCYSGGLVSWNRKGTITNSYAIGNSICSGSTCRSGGLVGHNYRGTITNSHATGDSICTGESCLSGGLVGFNNIGTITNSYATGDSSGRISGGLVGYNYGRITASYATGYSTCDRSFCDNGGLVGLNSGTISNSYATSDSICTGESCLSGGLVGENHHGTISNSYATGNSACDSSYCRSGGLVSSSYNGTIINSYATGNSTCSNSSCRSGGLIGYNRIGRIANSYATGYSTCSGPYCHSGGLVGGNIGTITNSYRVQTTGNTLGTAITLANLRAATSFSFWTNPPWDFGTTSQLPTLQNLPLCPSRIPSDISCRWSTPQSTTGTPTPPPTNTQDTDGDGTPDTMDSCPTDADITCQGIATDQDLIDLLHGTSGDDGYYRLTANITLSADTTWSPITNFRGTFNGDNHTITFRVTQPNPPLFDTINSTATVINIGILRSILAYTNHGNISYAYATGDSYGSIHRSISGIFRTSGYPYNFSGGLVDYNTGTIIHSYATGNSNSRGSGGLVGYNTGTITHSYATGNSTCNTSNCGSGGLVGSSRGTITNSYATGNSYRSGYSGGLVGRNVYGTIIYSYATGDSYGGGNGGGLVGFNFVGRITNSYATGHSTCTVPGCNSGGLIGDNSGIITSSYATGHSTCSGSHCNSGGLVGTNTGGPITNSYRVQANGVTNTLGTVITLPNLRATTSLSGWLSPPWDFGTTSQLPRHHNQTGIPLCPGATSYSDASCRW